MLTESDFERAAQHMIDIHGAAAHRAAIARARYLRSQDEHDAEQIWGRVAAVVAERQSQRRAMLNGNARPPTSRRYGSVDIEFVHQSVGMTWQITSPELPGWTCTGSSRATAIGQFPGSLRAYLERTQLPAETRHALRALLGMEPEENPEIHLSAGARANFLRLI